MLWGAPQYPGVGRTEHSALGDEMKAAGERKGGREGIREGFLTGTLWEKQNLLSWFTACPSNAVPEGAGQAP